MRDSSIEHACSPCKDNPSLILDCRSSFETLVNSSEWHSHNLVSVFGF